jgi:hypothetical protein
VKRGQQPRPGDEKLLAFFDSAISWRPTRDCPDADWLIDSLLGSGWAIVIRIGAPAEEVDVSQIVI